jgi:hypothetical protein
VYLSFYGAISSFEAAYFSFYSDKNSFGGVYLSFYDDILEFYGVSGGVSVSRGGPGGEDAAGAGAAPKTASGASRWATAPTRAASATS